MCNTFYKATSSQETNVNYTLKKEKDMAYKLYVSCVL